MRRPSGPAKSKLEFISRTVILCYIPEQFFFLSLLKNNIILAADRFCKLFQLHHELVLVKCSFKTNKLHYPFFSHLCKIGLIIGFILFNLPGMTDRISTQLKL